VGSILLKQVVHIVATGPQHFKVNGKWRDVYVKNNVGSEHDQRGMYRTYSIECSRARTCL
jgi:hypothetical protein